MKRTTILGLLALSLLAPALYRLATSSPSQTEPLPAGSPGAWKTAGVAKAPRLRPHHAEQPAAIATGTDLDRPSETSGLIGSNVSDAELPALCDSLARDTRQGATDSRQGLIRRWAKTDGPAAAAWTAQLDQEPAYHEVLTQVARGWAATDPAAALNWARTLPAGESRDTTTMDLGYETARTDPIKALEVAASLEPTPRRDDLIEHAISQWATKDFAAAVQWADDNASEPSLRQRLLASVAVAVAGQNGSAAATLAATALAPGEEQDRVAVAIVQRWVQHEPEQAATWVARFPDTPARETTAQNLVAFWAAQDREAAGQWLQGLPEGSLRSAGMTAYAQVR